MGPWSCSNDHLREAGCTSATPIATAHRSTIARTPKLPTLLPYSTVPVAQSAAVSLNLGSDIMSETSFQGFSVALEGGPHNAGHNWMGGTDSNGISGDMRTMRSPNDPAFWLHHAQVDHLWAVWQQGHPGALATGLSAEDRLLDPWENEFSVETVNDISTLGYIYK